MLAGRSLRLICVAAASFVTALIYRVVDDPHFRLTPTINQLLFLAYRIDLQQRDTGRAPA